MRHIARRKERDETNEQRQRHRSKSDAGQNRFTFRHIANRPQRHSFHGLQGPDQRRPDVDPILNTPRVRVPAFNNCETEALKCNQVVFLGFSLRSFWSSWRACLAASISLKRKRRRTTSNQRCMK